MATTLASSLTCIKTLPLTALIGCVCVFFVVCLFVARSINKYSEKIKRRAEISVGIDKMMRLNHDSIGCYSIKLNIYLCRLYHFRLYGLKEIDFISTRNEKKRHLSLVTCRFNLSTYHKTFSLRLLLVNVYGCDKDTL